MVILVTPRFGAVNDNTGTSLNDSAYNILSEDVVSADCLNGCDPSSVSYVELITEQQSDPSISEIKQAMRQKCSNAVKYLKMKSVAASTTAELD